MVGTCVFFRANIRTSFRSSVDSPSRYHRVCSGSGVRVLLAVISLMLRVSREVEQVMNAVSVCERAHGSLWLISAVRCERLQCAGGSVGSLMSWRDKSCTHLFPLSVELHSAASPLMNFLTSSHPGIVATRFITVQSPGPRLCVCE